MLPRCKLNVLILCERSQITTAAFRMLGHNAISVDLQPVTRNSLGIEYAQYHYTGDALDFLQSTPPDFWDLILAHPPCTYLCKAGAFHLHHDPKRWYHMYDAIDFFTELWQLSIKRAPYVCFENPVMHHYARKLLSVKPTDNIQPYNFGDPYSKQTWLFTHNLPPLFHTLQHSCHTSYIAKSGNTNFRCKSFSGIANAVANQYSQFILNDYVSRTRTLSTQSQ